MNLSKASKLNLFQKSIESVLKIRSAKIYNRSLIGNREWVAFGYNGQAYYDDDLTYPFPAIRYKEFTNELLALREKEKGDWRKLTIEEKKTLYRASFRQTFVEAEAPTGKWKTVLGFTLFMVSLGLWEFILFHLFIKPPLPSTFSDEHRRKMFRKMLVNMDGHLTGLSSKWDYETDDWKK